MLADARAVDRLDDFGDARFREPMRVLLGALDDAPLNEAGIELLVLSHIGNCPALVELVATRLEAML